MGKDGETEIAVGCLFFHSMLDVRCSMLDVHLSKHRRPLVPTLQRGNAYRHVPRDFSRALEPGVWQLALLLFALCSVLFALCQKP
jgi:hypothetical protein